MGKNKKEVEEAAVEWYIKNRPTYKKLSEKIKTIVSELLDVKELTYHMVTNRAKDIDSFKKKIQHEKYDDPINQITDLAGIRIITYVEDELKGVCNELENIFEIDKEQSLDKSEELGIDRVGYKSVHFIAKIKEDRLKLPEYAIYEGKFFEIQIRTILQHAWAEIEHDRNYKFSGKLPDEVSRRFKLLAGVLEIADREFNNIASEIDRISESVEAGTKSGKLDFEINSTSLKQYLETKFEDLWKGGFTLEPNIKEYILKEIEKYGISNLKEFDELVPDKFADEIINFQSSSSDKKIFAVGLIRLILIINDCDKYFTKSYSGDWQVWSSRRQYEGVFNKYDINWDNIHKEYDVEFG